MTSSQGLDPRSANRRRGRRAARWCALVGSLLPALAAGASYLWVDGIEGESTAVGHENWIEVDGFEAGLSSLAESGSGRLTWRVLPDPLRVSTALDRSTPYLLNSLFRGAVLPSVWLESDWGTSGPAPNQLRIVLTRARVADYLTESDAAPGAPGVVREQWSFDYEEWGHHYVRGDSNQTPGETLSATWNFATGEGGWTGQDSAARPTIEPFNTLVAAPGGTYSILFFVADDDTPMGDLQVWAESLDPEKVTVASVTGTEGKPGMQLRVSELFSGSASVRVSVSDGFQTSSRTLLLSIEGGETAYETFLLAAFGQSWVQDHYLGWPLYDPEGDGLRTVTEFFLGTDPSLPDDPRDAILAQPIEAGGKRLVRLSFFRRSDVPGLVGRFFASPDMENWVELSGQSVPRYAESSKPTSTFYDRVDAVVELPAQGWDTCFLRLEVQGAF